MRIDSPTERAPNLQQPPCMIVNYSTSCGRTRFALSLLWVAILVLPGRAEEPVDWGRTGLLPRNFGLTSLTPTSPATRPNRIRLFGIVPGFLSEAVGLDLDDSPPDPAHPPEPDDGPNWLQLSLGNDNPFFDLRRPGDLGGVGYYRLFTQVQLFETATTGCALGFRAATPAGRESNGVPDGPTHVAPALSVFHSLDENFAIQAFVGKKLRLDTRAQGPFHHAVEYGMAVHSPILDGPSGQGKLYVFVEALGRYRFAENGDQPRALDVVPGLHWRMGDNWWMSGGWIMPMTPGTRTENGQWQLTCWWQF